MSEIIDLSQEIYEGMPVYKNLPQVKMTVHNSHEEWNGIKNSKTKTPVVHKLELGEHTGTHVDAINHMAIQYKGKSIDTMPLSMFYTEGICLDFSHKGLKELIEPNEMENACLKAGVVIKKGDTVYCTTGESAGSTGKVLKINTEKGVAVIEGLNMVKKATRPSEAYPQGGFIEREAPMQISNVAIYNAKTEKADRVGISIEGGKKIRVYKSSGEAIDA